VKSSRGATRNRLTVISRTALPASFIRLPKTGDQTPRPENASISVATDPINVAANSINEIDLKKCAGDRRKGADDQTER
jgi:hypothetical protein